MIGIFKRIFSKKSESLESEIFSKKSEILKIVKRDFQINFYGDHGIYHWERVYINTQILAKHYGIKSDVFELFALLHDSKREDEYKDIEHGKRAEEFARDLINKGLIELNDIDTKRLIYACKNHTLPEQSNPLYEDLIVQICFDSDRLDIGRVGITPERKYLFTKYAKSLVSN